MRIPTSFGMIRPWKRDDSAALVKYANNRKVWLNLRDAFPHPYTEASAATFLELVFRRIPLRFSRSLRKTKASEESVSLSIRTCIV
jgi:hypothetical protein